MKNQRPRSFGFRWLCCTLIAATTMLFALQNMGQAMLAPAEIAGQPNQHASPSDSRAQDMKAVQSALESKIVRQRLKELGLDDKQVQSRLDKLSDKDLHQLALKSRAVNAGGDYDAGGAIFGLLLIALLVVLIVYIVKKL